MWWKRDNDLLCTDFPGLALMLVAFLSLCVCEREREQAGLGEEGGQFTNTCPHMSLKTGTRSMGQMKNGKKTNGLGLQSSAANRHRKSLPITPLI